MKKNCTQKISGFTLIEMMIVVSLIAILAAVALPAYNNYVNRSKIKTAQADLVALSLLYENRYQRQLSYPATDYADTAAVTAVFTNWSPASKSTEFSFSSTGSSASTYTIRATGISGGVNNCVISLNKAGARTITASTGFTCAYTNGGVWL
jgi:type IV pilus assembly protein PilE